MDRIERIQIVTSHDDVRKSEMSYRFHVFISKERYDVCAQAIKGILDIQQSHNPLLNHIYIYVSTMWADWTSPL